MKVLSVVFTLVALFSLLARNSWAGFGKDLQRGGEAIERSVN